MTDDPPRQDPPPGPAPRRGRAVTAVIVLAVAVAIVVVIAVIPKREREVPPPTVPPVDVEVLPIVPLPEMDDAIELPAVIEPHLVSWDVDRNSMKPELLLLRLAVSLRPSPENCPDTRHEYSRAERFCDEVIGADLEPGDHIRVFGLGRQHHHRDRARPRVCLHATAHLQAIQTGQHQVQNHRVRRFCNDFLERLLAIGHGHDAVPFSVQVEPCQFQDVGFHAR